MAALQESPTPLLVLRPCSEPGMVLLVMRGPISRAAIPGLCERVRDLLEEQDGDLVVCDVGALGDPDAVTIDALARLQLTARRLGRRIWLDQACGWLRELLALAGLNDIVPLVPPSPLEPGGQTEEREPARGIEEEADPGDPIA